MSIFNQFVGRYILALDGLMDVQGAETRQQYEARIEAVVEELLADAYAGMNMWNAGATQFTDTVREFMEENNISRKPGTENGVKETNGPPAEARKNTTQKGGERYAVDEFYVNEIEEWNDLGRPDGQVFTLGSIGDVLQGLGAIESDIYMLGDKIRTILSEHPEMTLGEVKKIPQILEDPILVLKSRNIGREKKNNTRLVLFGNIKAQNGQPVLVALDLRPIEKGFSIDDMQKVVSSYTKTNSPEEFIKNSDVLYAEKNRTAKLLRTIGFQMPIELQQSGYIGSISYLGQKVNLQGVKFSDVIKLTNNDRYSVDDTSSYAELETDCEGRGLTVEQREYFAESQVRDNEGRLLVLYHQTDNDFTIFDPRHPGAGSYDAETPFGIFLKRSSGDIGLTGKKQMELYANITNPLRVANRVELKSRLREISSDYAEISDRHEVLDREYQRKLDAAAKAWQDYAAEWRKENPDAGRRAIYGDAVFMELFDAEDSITDEWVAASNQLSSQAKEIITRDLQEAGYDGIFLENDVGSWGRRTDAIIALSPEQVKAVSNKNPTIKPDIRYSVDDTSVISEAEDGRQEEPARADIAGQNVRAYANAHKQDLQQQEEAWRKRMREADRERLQGIKKSETESLTTIAKRDLRSTLLNQFSVPDGQKAELGSIIDGYADRLLKKGSLTEEDRQRLFDRMQDVFCLRNKLRNANKFL